MLHRMTNSLRRMSGYSGQKLCRVVEELEKFAPVSLAEKWDNVGLLIEPYNERVVKKILLTNDLTVPVMNEAIEKTVDMIISYHPPIFKPLTRITKCNWKERIVAACLANNIALYSPHTAWDKIEGGVNDWLSKAVPTESIKPIVPEIDASPGTGSGRYIETNVPIFMLIHALQDHIENNVHLALGVGHKTKTIVRTVALCAGSGASLLRGSKVDLVITGEMSHHELLDFNHSGTTVLLCNHSHSERGFLREFEKILGERLQGACEIILSQEDKDPLSTAVKAERPVSTPKQAEQ